MANKTSFGRIEKWYPHQESNPDPRFRKPLLYPLELWEHRRSGGQSINSFSSGQKIVHRSIRRRDLVGDRDFEVDLKAYEIGNLNAPFERGID
jgi:hypothetical protein